MADSAEISLDGKSVKDRVSPATPCLDNTHELAAENQSGAAAIAKPRGKICVPFNGLPSDKDLLQQLRGYPIETQGLPSDATIDQAEEYFRKVRQGGADLGQLCEQKQVCSIGEQHRYLPPKDFVAQQIDKLGKAGYTQFGFEMIDSSDSQILQGYVDGNVSQDELLKDELFGGFNWAPGVPEHYIAMLDAIKNYNVDPNRTGKPIQVFGQDSRSLMLIRDFEEQDKQRNKHWAQVIADRLQSNPGERIVTYSGEGHLSVNNPPYSTLNGELQRRGIEAATISLETAPPDRAPSVNENIAQGAERAGINEPTPYRMTPEKSGVQRADYGVVLPWYQLASPPPGQDVTPPGDKERERIGQVDIPLHDGGNGKLFIRTALDGKVTQLSYRNGDEQATTADMGFENKPDSRWFHWRDE